MPNLECYICGNPSRRECHECGGPCCGGKHEKGCAVFCSFCEEYYCPPHAGTCRNCGKSFVTYKHLQKYCSNKCKFESQIKYKICEYCGKEYFGSSTKFCSVTCSNRDKWKDKKNMVK